MEGFIEIEVTEKDDLGLMETNSRAGKSKNKKGKNKMSETPGDATPSSHKRKRGKATSVSPSLNGEDEEERESVCRLVAERLRHNAKLVVTETSQDEASRRVDTRYA